MITTRYSNVRTAGQALAALTAAGFEPADVVYMALALDPPAAAAVRGALPHALVFDREPAGWDQERGWGNDWLLEEGEVARRRY